MYALEPHLVVQTANVGGSFRHAAHAAARTKGATGSSHHHDLNGVIDPRVLERRYPGVNHRRGKGVQSFGPVQRDGGYAVIANFVLQLSRAHAACTPENRGTTERRPARVLHAPASGNTESQALPASRQRLCWAAYRRRRRSAPRRRPPPRVALASSSEIDLRAPCCRRQPPRRNPANG